MKNNSKSSTNEKTKVTKSSDIHSHRDHQHGATCGCKSVKHGNHVDYVYDGKGHRIHGNPIDENDE